MTHLILASQSPRRRILLQQIGLSFRIVPSRIDERFRASETPGRNARRIALEKASEVARRVRRGIVVGADTVVALKGKILGKPSTPAEAKRMLRMLSGTEHEVFTGFAIVDAASGAHTAGVERTRVRFRHLTDLEIAEYVRSGSPMDKAGAYGIQDDYGAVFVDRVCGCFYTVVGFPLARFYSELRRFRRRLNHHPQRTNHGTKNQSSHRQGRTRRA